MSHPRPMPSDEELRMMMAQVADIHEVLMGNGDPKKGLVYKVAKVEDHVSFMNRFGWILIVAVVGVLAKEIINWVHITIPNGG